MLAQTTAAQAGRDLDLDAYFERIGWRGPITRSYATVAGLLRAHMERIPFENLDVLLGRPIRLDVPSLQAKLVSARRGGYCFEHATLFAEVLDALGFATMRHTARVVLYTARDAAARSHMCLTVELTEGRFMLDPGFGAFAPRVPVPVIEGERVSFGRDVHWMEREGSTWILRTTSAGNALDCWISNLERDNPVDFEMSNHYVSTHPASAFVNRMMLRALTPAGHIGVMNRDVTTWRGEAREATRIADRAALRALLAEHFGFDLPEVERMRVPDVPEWT